MVAVRRRAVVAGLSYKKRGLREENGEVKEESAKENGPPFLFGLALNGAGMGGVVKIRGRLK